VGDRVKENFTFLLAELALALRLRKSNTIKFFTDSSRCCSSTAGLKIKRAFGLWRVYPYTSIFIYWVLSG
jgi:hypothetical protein